MNMINFSKYEQNKSLQPFRCELSDPTVWTWTDVLQLHQRFDVIDARRFPIGVCGAKSLLHQVLLLPLDLHHVLLHWTFHNELQQQTHKIKI